MASGASNAIDLATNLGEVGFGEFTEDLVINIFNALVSNSVQQTQQYLDLVAATSASLTEYVNANHDEVDPMEVKQFLVALNIDLGSVLAADRDRLNDALELTGGIGVGGGNNREATTNPTAAVKDKIREAVARRIAANRYEFLKQMVKMGVLRIVVDHGLVETRLSFRVSGRSSRGSRQSSLTRDTLDVGYAGAAGIGIGGLQGTGIGGVGAGGGGGYNQSYIAVQTTNDSDRDVTGSRVQIYGRVKLNYKTDYQPLNPAGN